MFKKKTSEQAMQNVVDDVLVGPVNHAVTKVAILTVVATAVVISVGVYTAYRMGKISIG